MARSVTVGNGNMLVGLDACGQVRDLYYPYVGEANHVSGASGNHIHRIGVSVDGVTTWISDDSWRVEVGGAGDTCIGSIEAINEKYEVTITSRDTVHNEHNIFLRQFEVINTGVENREIKLFLAQQFRLYESRRGDTGYFDPRVGAIVHYKGETTLLVNAVTNGQQFSEYNIGLFGIEGKEGTWMDAMDGQLEHNPIEHGSVDSVLALPMNLAAGASQFAHYWIACAPSVPEAHVLDKLVLDETPEALISSTESYWKAWLDKENRDFGSLSDDVQILFQRSLMVMRVHTDNRGGIIASSDTSMLHHGRDCYSYVWPRDGAIIAHVFDELGYRDVSRRFYDFIAKCQEPDGYLMHKYRSDGVLGSSWHPWMIDGQAHLPIQEDETASILFVLWKHYERYKNLEYIESLYNSFIEPAANFLVDYIEPTTGLPQASFDLWEEKYGTSTYTTASVIAGLRAAARFAQMLGKDEPARTYGAVAARMESALVEVLYDDEIGSFIKHVKHVDGEFEFDRTVDTSSLHGLLFFEIFDVRDDRVESTLRTVEDRLSVQGESRGFVRYEHDNYYTQHDAGSPNPWVICTLWVARYYIERAEKIEDLSYPKELLEWTCSHATKSGVLAEQMQPHTREHLSASPLVWSHAEFVLTVEQYQRKLTRLQVAR